jgi:tRNA/rRNA methyltransferase
MNVYFILVEPQTPENVGSSARAIKTMGFTEMRLINPCDHLDKNARKLAYGSEEILENASIFPSLADAIKDIDFVIATSAKQRTVKFDHHPSTGILDIIQRKGSAISSVGIVFGREDRGLENEEIALCQLVTYVPLRLPYPSLNLSQAVMLYAYCLSPLQISPSQETLKKSDQHEFKSLTEKITGLLETLDLGKDKLIFNRILERIALLNEDDIHILHSITAKMIEKGKK